MSSLGGGDGETEYGMEYEEWRTENATTSVTIDDESDLLKSGIVISDCTNSVVLRSAAMTEAQQDLSHELVTCSVVRFDSP